MREGVREWGVRERGSEGVREEGSEEGGEGGRETNKAPLHTVCNFCCQIY